MGTPKRRCLPFSTTAAANCKAPAHTFLMDLQLLPDLEYADNMTVLCVNNGPHVMNHKHWDLRAFLQRVTALNKDQ